MKIVNLDDFPRAKRFLQKHDLKLKDIDKALKILDRSIKTQLAEINKLQGE